MDEATGSTISADTLKGYFTISIIGPIVFKLPTPEVTINSKNVKHLA